MYITLTAQQIHTVKAYLRPPKLTSVDSVNIHLLAISRLQTVIDQAKFSPLMRKLNVNN
jgi:hypothetical protein